MSPRALFVIGTVWFMAATALVMRFARTDSAFGFVIPDPVSHPTSFFAVCLIIISTLFLLVGWVIPVAVGVYRLLRH